MPNQDTFLDRSKKWLESYGYSIHAHSRDGKWASFTNTGGEIRIRPIIECQITENGEEQARVSWIALKMFINLQSGWFAFEHPDLLKFLAVVEHYGTLCDRHPPWK